MKAIGKVDEKIVLVPDTRMTYSVTLLKLATEELEPLYKLLLEAGSDYKLKNKSGKSCLDYAGEYSWRSSLLDIINDYEEGRNNESL